MAPATSPPITVHSLSGPDLKAKARSITATSVTSSHPSSTTFQPGLSSTSSAPEMFGFSTALRSATQGKAEFSMEFAKYSPTPSSVSEELVKKYRDAEAQKKK